MARGEQPRKLIDGLVPFSVRLDPDLYERLVERARADHRTVAAEVRRLIELHVGAAPEAADELSA